MKKLLGIVVLGLLFSGNANARVIGLESCIVDLAGFCIVETLIVLVIVAVLLFLLGLPLRKLIKSHIETNLKKNKKYKPNKLLLFVYESSGLIVMFVLSVIVTLMFI
jgi:uncharacterized protein HemY